MSALDHTSIASGNLRHVDSRKLGMRIMLIALHILIVFCSFKMFQLVGACIPTVVLCIVVLIATGIWYNCVFVLFPQPLVFSARDKFFVA